jgi:hypothetical protein
VKWLIPITLTRISSRVASIPNFSFKILATSKNNVPFVLSANPSLLPAFEMLDKGSKDSGIMIGNGDYLNAESSNYFAAGSIVLLFKNGTLSTRDASNKKDIATYNVGERVKIKVEADIQSGIYDVYVDGELKAEGVAFRQSADMLDTLALVENGGGVPFDIYNFRVTQ